MPAYPSAAVREYRFRSCRLCQSSREIWVEDKLVTAEPKVFDLLVYLVANRDRAIDKNELQDAIWPRAIVTEASLSRCVMKARRAIGDYGAEMIATVRGHGYRFAVPVEERHGSSPSDAALPVPDKPSIVVLPFVNIGNDPEQEYFADGITDDIITELSRFRSLFVIARPSAFSFKGRQVRSRDVARELGVAYVVDGSLQRRGDRIRLHARLVDAQSETQLWAERYNRELEDIFIVQEELAATIAATVGGRVEATRGRQRVDRAAFESYDCLLRAQSLYYDFRKEANQQARALLERAIEIDPDNARALALLAAVHSMDSWAFWVPDNEESQRLSCELGKRSVELDDTDSLALALYGEILHDCGRVELAEHYFQRAIAINPNDIAARALYASKLGATGRVDEGLAQLDVAERLDPYGLFWLPLIKGSLMYLSRRYEETVSAIAAMTSAPVEAQLIMLGALGRLGRTDEAETLLQQTLAAARSEMPNYPGGSLTDWLDIIRRMRGNPPPDELAHFTESLSLAGWN